MDNKREELNNFLVKSFNYLLNNEEKSIERISDNKLTIKEVHLIEVIGDKEKVGNNTSSEIAKELNITLGTLTTTTNVLEKKGYIERIKKADVDKRVVRLTLTEQGFKIYKKHKAYHEKLAYDALQNTTKEEQEILLNALRIIENYYLKGEI